MNTCVEMWAAWSEAPGDYPADVTGDRLCWGWSWDDPEWVWLFVEDEGRRGTVMVKVRRAELRLAMIQIQRDVQLTDDELASDREEAIRNHPYLCDADFLSAEQAEAGRVKADEADRQFPGQLHWGGGVAGEPADDGLGGAGGALAVKRGVDGDPRTSNA